jgi:hypothetical protein
MRSIEYGDFQTPAALADQVVRTLVRRGVMPMSVLEPTVGRGELLLAALRAFPDCKQALGVDINAAHLRAARLGVRALDPSASVRLRRADVFAIDLEQQALALPAPVLILGNPPWVTSARLSVLGSSNLPARSNFQHRSGLDAVTGKSNFDISEWILMHLLESLSQTQGVLAMLCKTKVARRVLSYCVDRHLPIRHAALYAIDASLHFGASVEACLLVCERGRARAEIPCDVYAALQAPGPARRFLFVRGLAIADAAAFRRSRHLLGPSPLRWRSGIKHDCAAVMELVRGARGWTNAAGDAVIIERVHVFPMLKGADLARGELGSDRRWMLVPQRRTGQDPARIARTAPKTWKYLVDHQPALQRRASAVYRHRPPFSVFGVGDYAFTDWKVALAAMHKRLAFHLVGPVCGRPVVFDDTCYFLACRSELQARVVHALLQLDLTSDFLSSMIFWGDKRPVTLELLERLDIGKLAEHGGSTAQQLLACQGYQEAEVREELDHLARASVA